MDDGNGVLVDIGHPAHVHVFKNVLRLLQERGIAVYVTARDKDVALGLLDAYGIPYERIGGHRVGLVQKALHSTTRVRGIARAIRKHHIGSAMGVHNSYVAIAGAITQTPTAILVDSEPVPNDRLLTYPFARHLLTPTGFARNLGRKQIRFDGFKELAYLHPNYFKPNPQVLDELGVSRDEPFSLIRFVAWAAVHDLGQRGLSRDQKLRLVRMLERNGRVWISAEGQLPAEVAAYRLPLPPEKMHDVLAFASLLVSESQTMTTEAAILGTPVVQTNTLVGTMSNFSELQDRYGLIRSERDGDKALEIADGLARDPKAKSMAKSNRERLLAEKIDVAAYLAESAVRMLDGLAPLEGRLPR